MAKQRVQVQDLPEAPALQPTVLQRGREAIASKQAGSNSLLNLADTLKHVNPALQNYAAIQDLDYENFKKELLRLSPEERKKVVTQPRDEMDKLVRKNVIPFMGNAWNWKRKSRAIGALMHDEFQQTLQENLDDPALADQSVDKIVQMTRETLEEGAPILTTDTYAREGFQEAINPTVSAYKLRYDKIKNDAEQLRIKDATQAQLHRISSMGVSSEGAREIEDIWEAIEGSQTPEALRDIIEQVALTHAASGNVKAAKEFARFAAGHLKMGTSLMGDPNTKDDDVFGLYTDKVAALMEKIDRIDKARGDDDVREARIKDAEIAAEASKLYHRLANWDNSKGAFRVDPNDPNSQVIRDEKDLYNYLYEKHSGDDNPFVVQALAKTLRNAEGLAQIPDTNIVQLQNVFNQLFAAEKALAMQNVAAKEEGMEAELTEPRAKEEYFDKFVKARERYDEKFNAKRREIASGNFTTVDGVTVTGNLEYAETALHLKQWSDKYAEEYSQEIEDLNADIRKVQEVVTKSARTSGEDQNIAAKDQKSFIHPDKTIDDTSTVLGPDKHEGYWENLEVAAVEGNWEDSKQAVRGLRNIGKLTEAYNTMYDLNKRHTHEQRRVAARKLMLAMVAEGVFLKGDRALVEGRVKFNLGQGQFVTVELDMKALKKLIPLYPLITRERAEKALKAYQTDAYYDESYVRKVLSKIEGVLEENILEDHINQFLKLQLEVHARENTDE